MEVTHFEEKPSYKIQQLIDKENIYVSVSVLFISA